MAKQQTQAGPADRTGLADRTGPADRTGVADRTGLAAKIAAAVAQVPGVGGLSWTDAPAYAPGSKAAGIHLRPHIAEIYIRANALPLPPVAAAAAKAARRVLREAGDSREVSINIEDLDASVTALPAANGKRKGAADARR